MKLIDVAQDGPNGKILYSASDCIRAGKVWKYECIDLYTDIAVV
jgi:hypothetical protein